MGKAEETVREEKVTSVTARKEEKEENVERKEEETCVPVETLVPSKGHVVNTTDKPHGGLN